MVESAFLVLNQPSGVGRRPADIERLQHAFRDAFGFVPHCTCTVTDGHEAVVRCTRAFLASHPGPSFLLAGGGSGTTRALVQGIMEEVEAGRTHLERVQISSLRLGSANVIAKHFHVPADPLEAIRCLRDGLLVGRVSPCCVYRCCFRGLHGDGEPLYGITLGGLGRFARVPGTVARWKGHHRRLTRWASRIVPLEGITALQYALAAGRELLTARRGDLVEVRADGRTETFRAVFGFLLNFEIPHLPVRGDCRAGEARLRLCFVPPEERLGLVRTHLTPWIRQGGIRRYEITPGHPVEVFFAEQDSTVVTLDQDVFTLPSRLTFNVAGLVAYVTGREGARPVALVDTP